jgi:hypothetical protein
VLAAGPPRPVHHAELGRAAGPEQRQAKWRLGASVRQQTAALFPSTDTVIAYRLLFGALTGIVPDGIAGLGVTDLDWAGDGTVLLDYLKGRTAAESVTLNRRAVRLLEQWLEHSAVLRRSAPPALRGALWLRHAPEGRGPCEAGAVDSRTIQRWVKRHGLLADDGQLLPIHRHRIRTTFESHRDRRAWFGSNRATIDPNHSAPVEGDHHLTASTAAQRDNIDTIIADARADLLRKAHPAAVLTTAEAAERAGRFPELVRGPQLDQAAITELVGGQRDVFVAACADPLSGLHGPKGKPCPARPWVCLLCPLAVFAPPARGEPAPAEGVLRPAVAAPARRPCPGTLQAGTRTRSRIGRCAPASSTETHALTTTQRDRHVRAPARTQQAARRRSAAAPAPRSEE